MFSTPVATSRARPRGIATAAAGTASADAPSTPAGGSLTRRRTTGAATPATTRAQAPARIALETRKARQYRRPPRRGRAQNRPLERHFSVSGGRPIADRLRSGGNARGAGPAAGLIECRPPCDTTSTTLRPFVGDANERAPLGGFAASSAPLQRLRSS